MLWLCYRRSLDRNKGPVSRKQLAPRMQIIIILCIPLEHAIFLSVQNCSLTFHVKYFQLMFLVSLLLFVKLLAAFCLFDQQVVYYLAYMLRHALMFSSSVAEKWGKWRGARRREGESRGLHVVSARPSVTRVSSSVATRLCNSAFVPESVDHGRVPAVLLHDMCVGKLKTMFLRTCAAVFFCLYWCFCLPCSLGW